MSNIPPFEEANNELRAILRRYQVPENIVWVAPEHTIMCGREWAILDGECLEEKAVKSEYGTARRDGLHRIKLGLLCIDSSHSYCYIYVPATATDAEYALLVDRGVKICVPARIPAGKLLHRQDLRVLWYMAWERMHLKLKAAAFGRP